MSLSGLFPPAEEMGTELRWCGEGDWALFCRPPGDGGRLRLGEACGDRSDGVVTRGGLGGGAGLGGGGGGGPIAWSGRPGDREVVASAASETSDR